MEIFRIFSLCVCANLEKKCLSLDQPASHDQFRPKMWMSLATALVKLVDGLKQEPQASPSSLVPLSDIKDIDLRIEVSISGFIF